MLQPDLLEELAALGVNELVIVAEPPAEPDDAADGVTRTRPAAPDYAHGTPWMPPRSATAGWKASVPPAWPHAGSVGEAGSRISSAVG